MIIDGKKIRDDILSDLHGKISGMQTKPMLALFLPEHPDFATESFVKIKKRIGEKIGVVIAEHTLDSKLTTDEVIAEIECVGKDSDGIIVQFPTSPHLDAEKIRNAIPLSHDVDGVSDAAVAVFAKGESAILPPVVGAIAEICQREQIEITHKNVVIVGNGRLVGQPASVWFTQKGGIVEVLDREAGDLSPVKDADILVLGAGSPGLITPYMIREGVILFDAGTSEAEGKLSGDADPACRDKCSLFTPVPGGIGPITVAYIFKNLLTLQKG
jgi:methylenetetrahydrofolate dehydrogenase (NADP+)/methenyltetrahydrofolate cyclohydrolase